MKIVTWSLRTTIAAILLIACATGNTKAGFITYLETTTGSGTLGGVAFTNALVTLTATADTSNVTGSSGFFTVHPTTATVSVDGFSPATFTSSTFDVIDNQSFSNNGITGIVGFGDTNSGTVLGDSNAAFQSYSLTTSIGPLTGADFIRSDVTFATTAGGFVLSSAGPATFQAIIGVPEPSSLALSVIAGAIGLGVARTRRNRPAA